MRTWWRKLSSFLWWTYPRGTVEYDIMVGIILAFIFLIPRGTFRDQPQPFSARPLAVTLVSAAHGREYEILGAGRNADIPGILERYTGRRVKIREIKTVGGDSDTDVIYNVWTD